jgi:hypothetical protein
VIQNQCRGDKLLGELQLAAHGNKEHAAGYQWPPRVRVRKGEVTGAGNRLVSGWAIHRWWEPGGSQVGARWGTHMEAMSRL